MQNNHIEQIASINHYTLQITGMQIIDLLRGGPQNGGGTRKDISAKRGGFPLKNWSKIKFDSENAISPHLESTASIIKIVI